MSVDEIKEVLAREDTAFRELLDEHHRYERKLAILGQKSALSAEEELEEKTLKKQKLWVKDRMMERIRGAAAAM